ncbi:MAG: family 16 glycoside hydrolase [Pseudomonadota bacterium]
MEPLLGEGFSDDFSRASLGENWRTTGGNFRIEDGALKVQGARNHVLWLKRRLPRDILMTFTTWSDTSEGDIKFELFGDGFSTSTGEGAYTASGYVMVFGGWNNSISIIARMDEHGQDRKATKRLKVKAGQRYRMKVESKDTKLRWWIDDNLFLTYDDNTPLKGRGHEYFGLNNWESPVSFDDLEIKPLQ